MLALILSCYVADCNEVSKDGLRATWREIIIKTRSEFYKTLVMR